MSFNQKVSLPKVTLPNNSEIFCLQKNEEIFLMYEQVQEYFRHGIELNEGDTVFDVGANIGMFSLWVYKLCNNNINIYAFEPVPQTYQVLEQNVKSLDPEKIKAIACGLSKTSKVEKFGYYPNTTSISTAYPDGSKEEIDKFKKAAFQKIDAIRNHNDLSSSLYWYTKIPRFLLSLILDYKLKKAFIVEQVTCQLRTLSEVIHEYKVQQIDLLKIDVEKSELDVLLGIEEQDWSKIKQIVLEVHDLENRVEKISTLLTDKGFNKVIVEQEKYLKGTDICNMYALREFGIPN
ncbi:FkbM family methyltransferase [Nostoc cf. edaphicum LEGE 07299]|uniref:FkbM family methyltransferase n=1 Tax=Nostoc cf. edaphicum LEGE 07299 TaxID=2777974 RepID=A0ABR9U1A9_9NOSO|nr:FkbM family methyltransferase [Nostoc edaphicum]MBE9106436.1 FkbM family methyltransferase [Nostoc cf. edaphicum LEGE 07299]